MEITINGEKHPLEEPRTLLALLQQLGLDSDLVVVERNRIILKPPEFEHTVLEANDVLEIVYFMGGG